MNPPVRETRAPSVVLWILIIGGIGFAAGFFGPMALDPDANQGPLVGIFISGPGGTILGLVMYAVSRALGISAERQWQVLWTSGAILGVATLGFLLSKPVLRGYVLDIQIQGCKSPAQGADAAVVDWNKRVAQVTWAAPRAGWEAETRRRLQDDPAAVIDVTVVRRNGIYESRKPWNIGRISATGWNPINEQKSYYAQYAGGSCADYPPGSKSVQFVSYNSVVTPTSPDNWPPRELANFLDLQRLEPVPAEYQKLAGN